MLTFTHVEIVFPPPRGVAQHDVVTRLIRKMLIFRVGGKAVANIDQPSTLQQFDLHPGGQMYWRHCVNLWVDIPLPPWAPNLQNLLENVKLEFQREFGENVIWMTVQEVYRIDAYDGVR